jgi:hypothetical protein
MNNATYRHSPRSHRVTGVSATAAVAIAGYLSLATPAHAQAVDDKAWIDVESFFPSVDSHVQVNSSIGQGTSLDFERDLGLGNHKSLPAVSAGVRLSTNFRVTGEFYSLKRGGSKILARDIVVDDITYPASVELRSELDTQIYRATIGYSFIHNDKFEMGGAIGLHLTNIKASFTGQGRVGAASLTTRIRKTEALAPLPTLGIYGSWAAAPNLTLAAHADYLKLSISDYDGRLINTAVSATYRIHRNIGVGISYRYVDYKLGVTKSNWNGEVDYAYKGPSVFLHFAL